MQRRYTEQQALTARFKRNQSTLEGQKREIQEELKSTEKNLVTLEKEKDTLKNEMEIITDKLETCGEDRKALADRNSELKSEIVQAESEYKKKISGKDGEIGELESRLANNKRLLEVCNEKNTRLCIIAEELLEKYENKGVFSSIVQKEPFLQFKKVELEKYVKEYRDRIEKNRQIKEAVKGN